MGNYPETLVNIEELRKNSRLNKHQHFSAAERAQKHNTLSGVPVVITNVFLGSLLFVSLSEQVPDLTVWISGFLALGAAFCSALQTFFNFEKLIEGHRRIANRYLQVQRTCEITKSEYLDKAIDKSNLCQKYREVLLEYNLINSDAEAYPTGNSDYKRAQEYDKHKQNEEQDGLMRKRLEGTIDRSPFPT
jgi:hypothetical protein